MPTWTREAVAESPPATRPGIWHRIRRPRSRVLRRLAHDPVALTCGAVLLLLIAVAITAPALMPQDPNLQNLSDRLQGPSWAHPLGTDSFGRDMLSRLLYGTRVSIQAGLVATVIAVVAGVPTGLLAGYFGRAADAGLNFGNEIIMAFPPLFLAVAIVGMMGPGLTNAMIAIGIIMVPRFFRISRSAARSIRHQSYIDAARVSGCRTGRIAFWHLLPNSSGPLLVQASFSFGLAIVAEASLSYLGLGVRDPTASWGSMVRDGFVNIRQTTWTIIPAAVMISIAVLAVSLLGDALRDALGRDVKDLNSA